MSRKHIVDTFESPPVAESDSVKWEFARRISSDLEPYWVADMDFPAPKAITDALRARVEHGLLGYTFARDSVFEAFADWQERRLGYRPPEHWAWIHGVMAGVRAAVSLYSKQGDSVIVQTPVYFPFMDAVEGQGRTLMVNELAHDGSRYRFDFDDLERKAASGAKLLLLCSPHNPVGRVWGADELQRVIDICRRHNVVIVSDEIHGDLIMPGYRFVPTASLDTDGLTLLTLSSATKSFNIPGLPGAICTAEAREPIDLIKDYMHSLGADTPNVLTLRAVEAAYRGGEEWLDEAMRYISHTAKEVHAIVGASSAPLTVEPLEGTYLMWIGCERVCVDDRRLREQLQHEANAWLVEGSRFGAGGEGALRMNIAAPRRRVCDAAARIVGILETVS
ncbi:MAG: MalY/PatB family protein [Spirochaetales bacterium]